MPDGTQGKEIESHGEGSVNEFPEKPRSLEILQGVIITSGQVDREVRVFASINSGLAV